MTNYPWMSLSGALVDSYVQFEREGYDVADLRTLCENADKTENFPEQAARAIYDMMQTRPMRKDFGFVEPNDYDEILKECSFSAEDKSVKPDKNKIKGAWTGRISGCLLGKPLEGQPLAVNRKILSAANNLPVKYYLLKNSTPESAFDDKILYKNACFADKFPYAASDDDTNYTVLSLLAIERHGFDFTPDNILETWLEQLPILSVCTAERVCYINALNGIPCPATATHYNPYREWIGGQIRTDFYGYVTPGQPKKAAYLAYKDNIISHVKNGVYGGMLIAAMTALAATEPDIKSVVEKGLGYIPRRSRLYSKCRELLGLYEKGYGFEKLLAHIRNGLCETDSRDWVDTVPNTLIVLASLLCGNGDFDVCPGLALSAGLDTDCNCATVGSICGMLCGFDKIDSRWHEIYGGKLKTNLSDFPLVSIDDLTERTIKLFK